MKSWKDIGQDAANMGKHGLGGFKKTGEALGDAAKGGAAATGFLGRAANWVAKAATIVVMAPFRLAARMWDSGFGGKMGAAATVVGATAAVGYGLHKHHQHKEQRQMQEAIEQNQAQIAATQAELGSTNSPAGDAAAKIEAQRLMAQRGAGVSA